ncbi:hypothetical protein [Bacillus massilinigeriensis]|nr:hypothetical protein [Bacillus massilionigeriensis]
MRLLIKNHSYKNWSENGTVAQNLLPHHNKMAVVAHVNEVMIF